MKKLLCTNDASETRVKNGIPFLGQNKARRVPDRSVNAQVIDYNTDL